MRPPFLRLLCVAALAAALLSSTGCVYMNVRQPLDTDLQNTDLGSKVGESDAQAILGLVAWGDAGTRAAAKNGGITTIKHADQETFAILGIVYTRVTTIVYGD
jgi:hypothetical protein